MQIDVELYRQDVVVSPEPVIRLRVIDIAPQQRLKTIIMLHGFGGNATQWKYQLWDFSDRNRCIAIDLRGHGQSDKPLTAYTVEEMVKDIRAVLRKLDIDVPVVVMGHSFGGAMAASFARIYPEMVSQVVLAATAYSFVVPFYTRALLSLPVAVLNLIRPLVRNQISAPPVVIKRYFRHALDVWDGRDELKQLTMPVLVLRGDRDLVFPRAHFEAVARLIPHAEEVNLGVSKHMVILERRDAVNRAVLRFLGQGGDTWRRHKSDMEDHIQLLAQRPWLNHYEEGVPFTLSIPAQPLPTLLTSAARRFPNRPATIFMNRTLTYRQLERQANRLANALRGMGVDTGVRVMILMPNVPQWVIAFYGVLKAGGIVVGASPVSSVQEIIREVKDSGARIMITLTRFAQTARTVKEAAGLEHVIYTNVKDYLTWWQKALFTLLRESREGHRLPMPLREGERTWVDLMRGYRPNPLEINVSPHNAALIQYTGGTTDNPKGVILSHRALIANAIQIRHWLPTATDGHERVFCVVPFAHSYGLTLGMNYSVAETRE